jgi:hypothetical protein
VLIEVALKTFLSQSVAVTALLGSSSAIRIYPLVLPQVPVWPCATYQRISGVRDRATLGPTGTTYARIQFDVWAADTKADGGGYLAAKNAADAMRKHLDGFRGLMGSSTVGQIFVQAVEIENDRDDYEPDARLYRVGFDVTLWFGEGTG